MAASNGVNVAVRGVYDVYVCNSYPVHINKIRAAFVISSIAVLIIASCTHFIFCSPYPGLQWFAAIACVSGIVVLTHTGEILNRKFHFITDHR